MLNDAQIGFHILKRKAAYASIQRTYLAKFLLNFFIINMVDNLSCFNIFFIKFIPTKEKFVNFKRMFLHLFLQRTTSNLTIAMNHYLKPLKIRMSCSINFTNIIQNKKNYHLDRDSSYGQTNIKPLRVHGFLSVAVRTRNLVTLSGVTNCYPISMYASPENKA